MPELLAGLAKWYRAMPKDPMERPFAELQRGAEGKFDDSDLVKIITEGIEDCSGE